MAEWFASGLAVDIVLGVIALEALLLAASRRLSLIDIVAALGPGVLILLALRAALTGAEWPWIALPLAASFPLHLLDLARRGGLTGRRRADRERA